MADKGGKEYLTVDELAQLLRTSRTTIYTYIKKGKLKGIQLERRRLFSKEEVRAFLGEDPFKAEPVEVILTPELEGAREELKRLDAMRRERKGQEVIERIKPLQKIFNEARDIHSLAYALFVEGGGLVNMGNFPKAASVLENALEHAGKLRDPLLEGLICGTLAPTESRRGRYDQALSLYNQAIRLFLKTGAKDKAAITFQNLGGFYRSINRPIEALFHFRRALEIAKTVKMPSYFEPSVLIALADVHITIGDNSQALSCGQHAWNIAQKRDNPALVAEATNMMARSQYNMGDIDGAHDLFNISYQHWEQLDSNLQDRYISMAINSMIGMADYVTSLKLLLRQSKLFKRKTKTPSELPGHLLNHAKCYIGLNQPDKALVYADEALRKQIEMGQLVALQAVFSILGKCHSALGDHASACKNYHEAIFYLEGEIDRSHAEGLPASFEYHISEYSQHLAEEAFNHQIDEKALSFILLLMAMRARRVIADFGIYPDPVKARAATRKYVRHVSTTVDFFSTVSKFPPGKLLPSHIRRYRERLENLRKIRKELVADIARENPHYLPLQGEESPTIDEIKTLYSDGRIPDTALILFIYLARNSGQGILVNSRGICKREEIDIGEQEAHGFLETLVSSSRSIGVLVEAGTAPSLVEQQNARGILGILYDKIIRPFDGFLDKNKPLIIVTNGPLTFLPFQALFDGQRYLCEYLPVYKVLSPAFLRVIRTANSPEAPKPPKLLVTSPWTKDDTCEALAFAGVMPRKNVTVRLGEKAIVSAIRPQISKHVSFLYVGEYISYNGNPQRASLKMHSGQGLTAHDLFTQRYRMESTRAVILHTGGLEQLIRGKPSEVFLPIQRGFLTSGVNLVTSFLWKMDFASLGKVLGEIYADFTSNGVISPETIRKAQIRLINDPFHSHPYFWAGILSFNLTVETRNI